MLPTSQCLWEVVWGQPGARGPSQVSYCPIVDRLFPHPTVQPDPPANVTVTAVDGNPLCLRVIWRDPPSWNSYYWLKFELRYRAEKEDNFRIWKVN